MAQATRVGIIGAGWPGVRHAEGYRAAGGFEVVAVADLIPSRRKALMQQFNVAGEFAGYEDLLAQADVEAVSVCLPNHLHAPAMLAALKAGKHVVCEVPPTLDAGEAKKVAAAATKANKSVLYAFQRRFGGNEQAARQAVAKGYAGDVYHARASWTRSRGIPTGTGWYTEKAKSGGGALIDLGLQMLDLAWALLGQPKPLTAFASASSRFRPPAGSDPARVFDVEDAGVAVVRFDGGKSLELAASWAINQPPNQQGTVCRVHGDRGAIDVYRPDGPALYHKFGPRGEAKEVLLKLPKLVHHAAMMRHFRECVLGRATPLVGPAEGLVLMQVVDAIYKSVGSGKSADVK
jgi:predicted dehydrogenase